MYLFVYLLLVHVTTLPLTNAVILWLFVYTFVDAFPKIWKATVSFISVGPYCLLLGISV